MNEDLYFQARAKEVLEIYSKVELELLELIIKKLQTNKGEIGGSTEWLIRRLQELGGLNKETLKIISKYTGITEKELKEIIKKVGIDTIEAVDLQEAYRNGKITINPKTFMQDKAIMTITKNAYDSTLKTFVEVNKNIVENVRRQYIDIINTAYLETSTGVYDYQTSIRKSLDKLAQSGITGATYRYSDGSERRYNIEGVVRRDLLTAMHQTSGKVMDEVVDITKPQYIKLSEHYQARPTHEPWQGCIVRADEFEEITGYGEVDGIYGINCKHSHYPYFGEVDKRKYKMVVGYYGGVYKAYTQMVMVDAEENARLYDLSQQQRALERHVREWKRKQTVATNDEDKIKANKKVKFWQHKLRNFTEDHPELRRDYLRERIGSRITNYKKANQTIIDKLQARSNELYYKSNKDLTALKEFTSVYGYYEDINQGLYRERGDISKIFSVDREKIVAIDKLMTDEIGENLILHRGTKAKYYKGYEVGDTITMYGFTETSLKRETIDIFIRKQETLGNKPMEMVIYAGEKTKGIYVGANTEARMNEYEMLLDRNLKCKIIKIEDNEKEAKMYLEVIE